MPPVEFGVSEIERGGAVLEAGIDLMSDARWGRVGDHRIELKHRI